MEKKRKSKVNKAKTLYLAMPPLSLGPCSLFTWIDLLSRATATSCLPKRKLLWLQDMTINQSTNQHLSYIILYLSSGLKTSTSKEFKKENIIWNYSTKPFSLENSLTASLIYTTLGTFPQGLDHKWILNRWGLIWQSLGPNQRMASCNLEERVRTHIYQK